MSPLIISLMLGAGSAAFMYSWFGPRLGYGNSQNVWLVTGISFVFVFLVFYILLNFVIEF